MLSGVHSDILSGIHSDLLFGICSDMLSGTFLTFYLARSGVVLAVEVR